MNMDMKPTEDTPRSFWRGSGFYVALAVCVAVIGGMAVLGVTDGLKKPSAGSGTATTTVSTTVTRHLPAAGRATSVRDARTTATSTATKAATTDTPSETLCVLPLTNAVTQRYSEKPVYWDTLDSWRVHLGVDFVGEAGAAVKAVSDGTVTSVFHDALWGDCITVDHGAGQLSTYCGVTATCAADTAVKAGDPIGTLSGIPCEQRLGPHLHLEWSVGGEAVDPLSVLQGEFRFVGAAAD